MRPANCRGPICVAVTCDVARVRLGKGPWRVEYWRAVRTPGEAADESWRQRRVRQGHPAGYPRRRRPAKSPIINSTEQVMLLFENKRMFCIIDGPRLKILQK
jgi:hypothetical protein